MLDLVRRPFANKNINIISEVQLPISQKYHCAKHLPAGQENSGSPVRKRPFPTEPILNGDASSKAPKTSTVHISPHSHRKPLNVKGNENNSDIEATQGGSRVGAHVTHAGVGTSGQRDNSHE